MAAAGIRVCPTLGGDPARLPPPERLPPPLRAALARLGHDLPSFMAARVGHARQMRARGVTVVTGTDAGISPAKAHGLVRFAVYDLVAAGWPVAEALATATSGAAAACGLTDVTGSLRHGLAADLLTVDGDLAVDVEALGRPVAVLAARRTSALVRHPAQLGHPGQRGADRGLEAVGGGGQGGVVRHAPGGRAWG